MKTYALLGVLALGFLVVDWASADDPANPIYRSSCTGLNNPTFHDHCYGCVVLDRDRHSDPPVMNCSSKYPKPEGTGLSIMIDECIGVYDGRLVHGRGASKSCRNFDNGYGRSDFITAVCKDSNGKEHESKIAIPIVFWGERMPSPHIKCAN